jgi:hypothetical protein
LTLKPGTLAADLISAQIGQLYVVMTSRLNGVKTLITAGTRVLAPTGRWSPSVTRLLARFRANRRIFAEPMLGI